MEKITEKQKEYFISTVDDTANGKAQLIKPQLSSIFLMCENIFLDSTNQHSSVCLFKNNSIDEQIMQLGLQSVIQSSELENLKFKDISLQNLQIIKQFPSSSSIQNLQLPSSDEDLILQELIKLNNYIVEMAQIFNFPIEQIYIVEASPRHMGGSNFQKLRSLQQKLKQNTLIKLCTTWSASENLFKQIANINSENALKIQGLFQNEIVYELKNGIGGSQGILDSLINLDNFHPQWKFQLIQSINYLSLLKQQLIQEQQKKGIQNFDDLRFPPILIKQSQDGLYQLIQEIKEIIKDQQFQIVICTNEIQSIIKEIDLKQDLQQKCDFKQIDEIFEQNNFMFCIFPQQNGHDNLHYFKQLLKYLLFKQPQFIDRLVLSNCFQYRTQLSYFGGLGYTQIFQILMETIHEQLFKQNEIQEEEKLSKSRELLKKIFYENTVKVLQWRMELKEVVIEGPKWKCFNCELMFDEKTQMKFEKMGKDFCSMKCITQCRSKGLLN